MRASLGGKILCRGAVFVRVRTSLSPCLGTSSRQLGMSPDDRQGEAIGEGSSSAGTTVDLPCQSPPVGRLGTPHPWHERFEIVDDKVVHKRYMTMYDRAIRFTPDEGEPHILHYDVVGHPRCAFSFAVAMPFHPTTESHPAQVTVVREYAQGPNRLQYCLPTGGFDPAKHSSLQECAVAEMAEEAALVGGEVLPLMPEHHPGQSELKWSQNTFKPFLIINPQPAPSGSACRDPEEHTIEVSRVTIPELRKLIASGEMMLPSVYACFLGLEVLAGRGLI